MCIRPRVLNLQPRGEMQPSPSCHPAHKALHGFKNLTARGTVASFSCCQNSPQYPPGERRGSWAKWIWPTDIWLADTRNSRHHENLKLIIWNNNRWSDLVRNLVRNSLQGSGTSPWDPNLHIFLEGNKAPCTLLREEEENFGRMDKLGAEISAIYVFWLSWNKQDPKQVADTAAERASEPIHRRKTRDLEQIQEATTYSNKFQNTSCLMWQLCQNLISIPFQALGNSSPTYQS